MQELVNVYILFYLFENFMDEYHVCNNNKEDVVMTLAESEGDIQGVRM